MISISLATQEMMIAFPLVWNLELRSLLGEILLVSAPRSQICVPRKLIFNHPNPNLKYGSWTNASSKSKVEHLAVVTTETEEEEAKSVLHKFLRKQGLTSAFATTTINKSDLFSEHLVTRLSSLKESGCPVGHELTATEIRDALVPYLESLLENYGCNLVDFLENFPNLPANGLPVASISSSSSLDDKRTKALSIVTGTDSYGLPPSHIPYLLELGMNMEQVKKMARKYPYFAKLSLDRKIKPLVEFLLSYGLSNSEISKILVKAPTLCGLNLSTNVAPTMMLLENMGLDKRQWRRVLCRFPVIVCLSVHKLEDTVDFLYEIGLSADGVGKVLTRFPQITGCSVENNLRPKAGYFESLGIQVDRLLARSPETFALGIEGKLKPTTTFFLENGFSREEFATMVLGYGTIYTCSLSNNLIPKWEFFLTTNYSREMLVKSPRYFGSSLEGRLKPRYASMKESGVELPLSTLLQSDAVFARALRNKIIQKATADASIAEIHKG